MSPRRRSTARVPIPLPPLSGRRHQASRPTNCLELRPTPQTVSFAGVPINLSTIARRLDVDHSYLSRIFAGYRRPRWYFSRRLADILGMSHAAFLAEIERLYTARYSRKSA